MNRELGKTSWVAMELNNLGYLELELGRVDEAGERFQESLRMTYEIKNMYLLPYCIVAAGVVAGRTGDFERATRLLAAGKAMFDATGAEMDPDDRVEYDRALARARQGLGEARFTSSWAEGRGFQIDQAVDYALVTSA